MSQSPAPGSSSTPPATTASTSNFEVIFREVLYFYKNKTNHDLTAHALVARLQEGDSLAATLDLLLAEVVRTRGSGESGIKRWLAPTINVLFSFSDMLGLPVQGIIILPLKVILTGLGVLLKAVKGEEESLVLINIFERIANIFRRLDVYTKVPPTQAITNMMVNIMVEVLDILGTVTREMKQSRLSSFIHRLWSPMAYVILEKFLKKVARIRKLEDGLKRFEKMTNEEAWIPNAKGRLVR